jgi:hypothetical protein
MNELQITLLVLAVLFIGGLYLLGQRRKQAHRAEQSPQQPPQQTQAEANSQSLQQDLFEQSPKSKIPNPIFLRKMAVLSSR